MTNKPTVPIKIETVYISEKEQPQNVIESHKALHKTEDLGQNLNQTQEDNADQAVCGHIYKSENKNILTQSTANESGMISVLNHDWKMFECNQCYKKFKSRSAQYTHKKTVHLGIIPTVLHCDQCAFTTKRKDHLKDHIKNILEKEVCDLCGKDFSFRSLIDHKELYTKEFFTTAPNAARTCQQKVILQLTRQDIKRENVLPAPNVDMVS